MEESAMKTVSLIIKPASGRCNLACAYCFYEDEAGRRERPDRGVMDEAMAEIVVDRALESGAGRWEFGFQGGEPTLAGLDFYRRFTGYARRRAAEAGSIELAWAIQTNGTLIDKDWARFLKDEGFLVGLSLDGPAAVHDALRRGPDGSASHARALAGYAALREAGVPVNALCVVSDQVAANAGLVYRWLRRRGFAWLQFIPCLEPLCPKEGGYPWSLSAPVYASFLRETFDLWYGELAAAPPGATLPSVRLFDDLVSMASDAPPPSCERAGRCGLHYVVEADGSVYPCDFYATDEWLLGNLRDSSLAELAKGGTAERFLATAEPDLKACSGCQVYSLCRGGCRRDRLLTDTGRLGLSRFCEAYKELLVYAGDRILALAR